jgi:four helix bundle protein
MGEQLLRASTSSGATYEEARAAENKAEFTRELRLVLRALRESMFWLKLIQKSGISRDPIVNTLIEHAQQMVNVLTKSVTSSKSE